MRSTLTFMLFLSFIALTGCTMSEAASRSSNLVTSFTYLDAAKIASDDSYRWIVGTLDMHYSPAIVVHTDPADPNSPLVSRSPVTGTCKVLAVLAGDVPMEDFALDYNEGPGGGSAGPYISLGNGTYVMRLPPGAPGKGRMRPYFELESAAQAKQVLEAVRYCREHPQALALHGWPPPEVPELQRLVKSGNPFLALPAFQRLANHGVVSPEDVTVVMRLESPAARGAALDHMKNAVDSGEYPGWAQAMRQHIKGATTAAELEGLAVSATRRTMSWDHPGEKLRRHVLDDMRAQYGRLGGTAEEKELLRSLLWRV